MTKDELQSVVFMSIGEASMCWSETPKGVFDCANASRIGDEVMQAIETYVASLQEQENGQKSGETPENEPTIRQ